MTDKKITKVGIGFVTGRKSFQKVLKTNLYNCMESGLTDRERTNLYLLVAYDLSYTNTKPTDYTNVSKELLNLIDGTYFIGNKEFKNELESLVDNNIINDYEANLLFGGGYAGKRNVVLYTAIKNKLDYLVFFDDDEYPLAVTKTRSTAVWGGQHVISTHLKHIVDADITNGHHCGYISPIPYIEFNQVLSEDTFKLFIEAISNDIINWDTISSVMKNGGVTYADTNILVSDDATEVPLINHTKFISGANLCINLTNLSRLYPFYNPPGARGEDTFLSTCLENRRVLRVPCYTFHDGFSTYHHIMDGVLPIKLKYIKGQDEGVKLRFLKACIGWIRYKPLYIYITQRDQYQEKINEMRQALNKALPDICQYFQNDEFMDILKELNKFDKKIKIHYKNYLDTQTAWSKICDYLEKEV